VLSVPSYVPERTMFFVHGAAICSRKHLLLLLPWHGAAHVVLL